MTQSLTTYDNYANQYAAQPSDGPGWLRGLRQRGMDSFSRLGFPTARRGNEAWKYTNVAPIARAEFDFRAAESGDPGFLGCGNSPWFDLNEDDWNSLVFLDGKYSPSMSVVHEPDSITISNLEGAVKSDGAAVRQNLGSLASIEDDGFTALNTAFIGDGAVIHVQPGVRVERPIHIGFITTDENTIAHPRVLVIAGPESEATIIESYTEDGGDAYFTNAVTEIVVGEGANVAHYRLMDESDSAYHVGVARVHQKDGSRFSSRAFYKGVGLGRHDLYTLIGDGCETDLSGLYITNGSQHVDNFINIDHAKPNSTSNLYYKGILSGRSRAVFGGTVFVREGAIKTDALQSDKNLLLSPDAEVDSKPALFIWADDVKCGHGATAGNVDEETVFYMRSRGVDLATASRLLIFGFATEIIDTVELPELRDYLERSFLDAIPPYEFTF